MRWKTLWRHNIFKNKTLIVWTRRIVWKWLRLRLHRHSCWSHYHLRFQKLNCSISAVLTTVWADLQSQRNCLASRLSLPGTFFNKSISKKVKTARITISKPYRRAVTKGHIKTFTPMKSPPRLIKNISSRRIKRHNRTLLDF